MSSTEERRGRKRKGEEEEVTGRGKRTIGLERGRGEEDRRGCERGLQGEGRGFGY